MARSEGNRHEPTGQFLTDKNNPEQRWVCELENRPEGGITRICCERRPRLRRTTCSTQQRSLPTLFACEAEPVCCACSLARASLHGCLVLGHAHRAASYVPGYQTSQPRSHFIAGFQSIVFWPLHPLSPGRGRAETEARGLGHTLYRKAWDWQQACAAKHLYISICGCRAGGVRCATLLLQHRRFLSRNQWTLAPMRQAFVPMRDGHVREDTVIHPLAINFFTVPASCTALCIPTSLLALGTASRCHWCGADPRHCQIVSHVTCCAEILAAGLPGPAAKLNTTRKVPTQLFQRQTCSKQVLGAMLSLNGLGRKGLTAHKRAHQLCLHSLPLHASVYLRRRFAGKQLRHVLVRDLPQRRRLALLLLLGQRRDLLPLPPLPHWLLPRHHMPCTQQHQGGAGTTCVMSVCTPLKTSILKIVRRFRTATDGKARERVAIRQTALAVHRVDSDAGSSG